MIQMYDMQIFTCNMHYHFHTDFPLNTKQKVIHQKEPV